MELGLSNVSKVTDEMVYEFYHMPFVKAFMQEPWHCINISCCQGIVLILVVSSKKFRIFIRLVFLAYMLGYDGGQYYMLISKNNM